MSVGCARADACARYHARPNILAALQVLAGYYTTVDGQLKLVSESLAGNVITMTGGVQALQISHFGIKGEVGTQPFGVVKTLQGYVFPSSPDKYCSL